MDSKEYYLVIDGQTMKTLHRDTRQQEEEAFREEMRSGLRAINERIDGINERIDGIDERIDGIDERIDKRIDKLVHGQEMLAQRIDGLKDNIDHLRHVFYWGFAILGIIIAMWSIFAPVYNDILERVRIRPHIQQVMPSPVPHTPHSDSHIQLPATSLEQ